MTATAVAEELRAVAEARDRAGAALICGAPRSSGRTAPVAAPGAQVFTAIAAALLKHSARNVFIHVRQLRAPEFQRTVAECARFAPEFRRRLHVLSGSSVESLLASIDLLVALDAPTLLAGCRNGLKPVWIGTALADAMDFSHQFRDVDSFEKALAASPPAGSLRLAEYRSFEEFLQSLIRQTRRDRRTIGMQQSVRRDLARTARQASTAERSLYRTLAGAAANPGAAWLLLRETLSVPAFPWRTRAGLAKQRLSRARLPI